jgi:hypothetical protein
MAAIDGSKSIAYQHRQSKIKHLDNMMGMRAVVAGKSMSGKGVVVQSMILRQFRGCFERVYVMSPTVFQDRSTWDPIRLFLQNDLKIDLKKEPAFFDTWNPEIIQKTIDDHAKVVKFQKERGDKLISGILWIIDDFADSPEIMHKQGNSILNKMFISGRHQQVSCICIVQALSLVSTTIRKNCTCALFFRATAKEAQFIEEEYRPSEIDRETWRHIFEECTKEKYSFMMVDFRRLVEEMFWKRFEFQIKLE